jgi:hypothetical protein
MPPQRTTPAFGYRNRQPPAGDRMVAVGKLASESVSLSVGEGATSGRVTARRGGAGKVWLSCTCAPALANGWCAHEVDLLCGRFENLSPVDRGSRAAFVEIVGGTPVSDAGQALDRAAGAFDACLSVFDKRRPRDIAGLGLGKFADVIADLAACSAELEDATSAFRRLLDHA